MARIQEWLSENKHRAYPFVEDADLGSLPGWMLLDMQLVDAAGAEAVLECTGFTVDSPHVDLHFRYGSAAFDVTVKIGTDISLGAVAVADGVKAKYAVYGGGNEYGFDVGNGPHVISPGARIMPSRVVSVGVHRSLHGLNGASGIIHVKDGYDTVARIADGVVYVTVGNGLGLGQPCLESDDAFDCSMALLFMNGQHADTQGNIDLVGGAGVSVQTGRTAFVDGKVIPAITVKVSETLEDVL